MTEEDAKDRVRSRQTLLWQPLKKAAVRRRSSSLMF